MSSITDTAVAGSGVPSYRFESTTGVIRRFVSPQDVIASLDEDVESMVALVHSGGTTFLSPILGRLAGIIACDGTLRSHLAIVSREFEVPCLVGAVVDPGLSDGATVRLDYVDGDRATVTVEAEPDRVDVETAVDQWWEYIRRVGDDIAVKDFDVVVTEEVLDALIAEPLTDAHLDDLVQHMGRTFKPEMTRRSGFTSELFPMMPYMSMSTIDDFHTYATRIRTIDATMSAQEIGRRLRGQAGVASPLWTWMAGYHYLTGRQNLIQMGVVAPTDRTDDIRTVVDFWRRLTLAQRGDGTLDNKDAGFTNRYLPDDEVASLLGHVTPLQAAEKKAFKRLNATVTGYLFLHFTDSRVGIYDSGPYPVGNGQVAIVRDLLCLRPSAFAYPWAEGLHSPYSALSLVLTFDPASFDSFEINDWGTTFTEPDQLLSEVTTVGVVGHTESGERVNLAPDDWPALSADISRIHGELYQRFADMTREERIFAATTMYSWGLKPFAALAGVVDDIDWSISPDTLALYPGPLGDDEKAGVIFGSAVVANDMPGSFSPVL
ncbi:PEP-utilizing enzyme [Rhodococcoides kyotonense]|uniref:Phosphohistidine swiveling domain-containing protein n=1 Tax=Rhodococcoides kyotonense TaxID=398843 RepID=A0A239DW31_9NOCA|nr:PEP-utilizing enzyme [Rhodococcus kyotonensis]SNS35932.1 Phosphohistidine swiveling domain-containing protein [Rhodococcus kyotonensis]